MKHVHRFLKCLMAVFLLCPLSIHGQADETAVPAGVSPDVQTAAPAEESTPECTAEAEPAASAKAEISASPEPAGGPGPALSSEELDALLQEHTYRELQDLFARDPELAGRFAASRLNEEQQCRYRDLYKEDSEQASAASLNPGLWQAPSAGLRRARAHPYSDLVQSSAFLLGDGVAETEQKYLYDGDGTSGTARFHVPLNEHGPAQANGDWRWQLSRTATVWYPHIGSWYGRPVGLALRIHDNSSSSPGISLCLREDDWGTNIYFEDISDLTNTITLYLDVDPQNPHVNGTQVRFDSRYAIFCGSHGLTDEDYRYNGQHYRSAEASGPVDAGMEVYTDHVDWIAQGTSTAGRTVYYCAADNKTIRTSFNVSGRSEASFYLGVVNRGGVSETTQLGGFDFNGWLAGVEHATFVVVDPNGGTYLGSADVTAHEGRAGETRQIEDSVWPHHVFQGYTLTQALGSWDPEQKRYTYGTPTENGLKYGRLTAQWTEQSLQWSAVKAVDRTESAQGDLLTYTITLSSPADETALDASSMTITDTLPDGTEFVRADQGGTCTNGRITWTLQNIARTEQPSVSFQVQILDDRFTPVDNQADFTVTHDDLQQTGTSNAVRTTLYEPDLQLQKQADRTVTDLGEVITWTLTLTNQGRGSSQPVIVRDPIPADTDYVTDSVSSDPETGVSGSYDAGTDTLFWSVPILKPDESRTMTFSTRVRDEVTNRIISNTAYWDPAGTGPQEDSTNSHASNQTDVPLADPQVTVEKTADPETGTAVTGGDVITYTLHIRNTGPGTAAYVHVYDEIPEYAVLVPDSVSDDGTVLADPQRVEWIIRMLKPGTEVTRSFQVQADAEGIGQTLRNQAFFRIYTSDPGTPGTLEKPDSSSNQTAHPIRLATVQISKAASVESGGTVRPGQQLTYTLTVTNPDTVTARCVAVQDLIPAGTEFTSSAQMTKAYHGTYLAQENKVCWLLEELAPGRSVTLQFKVRVTLSSGTITNRGDVLVTPVSPGLPGSWDLDFSQHSNPIIHKVEPYPLNRPPVPLTGA